MIQPDRIMIGNWVRYNDGIIDRNEQIRYGSQIDGYYSHLYPITLDCDILRANGYDNCVIAVGPDRKQFEITHVFEKICDDCVIQITLDPYVIDIFPYDGENNKADSTPVYTIPYGNGGVHELQQALILCGKEEEANDWII